MRSNIEKSIVRINVNAVGLKYSEPWSTRKAFSGSGTGFAVRINNKPYIITNAHVVDMSVKITVFIFGKTYPAKLHSISYECDLAIILPSESSKWYENMNFLEFGAMPVKGEKIYVYGFPYGGDNISVTKGIISRIDSVNYSDFVNRIAIQVDAAVNPGNSGGPALNKSGEVIGVVFSGIDNADNMGFAIPVVIVKYFVAYVEKHGKFMGLCDLGVSTQNLENADLRHHLKLPPTKSGVVVVGVVGEPQIQPLDIITSICGKTVDYSGNMKMHDIISHYSTTPGENEELASYDNYVGLVLPGDKIELEIYRSGKPVLVTTVAKFHKSVVPLYPTDISKKYVIIGGLVFVMLSHMFLSEKSKKGISLDASLEPGKQYVVLSKILQSEFTHGYVYDIYIIKMIGSRIITSIEDIVKSMLAARTKNKPIVITYLNTNMIHVISAEGNSEKNNKSVIEANIGAVDEYSLNKL